MKSKYNKQVYHNEWDTMELKQDSEPQRDKHGKLEKNPEN